MVSHIKLGKMPNLALCHTNSFPEEFERDYYVDDEISELYHNICETMSNGNNANNIRLFGDPGSGKTSFLYAIKNLSMRDDEVLRNYVFYLFHRV